MSSKSALLRISEGLIRVDYSLLRRDARLVSENTRVSCVSTHSVRGTRTNIIPQDIPREKAVPRGIAARIY
eukprot:267591-Prorocentrum_minimum.AAC.1